MAIGWLAVLQLVPWGDVISNAPKVAEGAKKLWKTVGKKSTGDELSSDMIAPPLKPDAQSMGMLQARLVALETMTRELHQHMLDSSELIKTLAEQNAQLVKRIELARVRFLMLTGTVTVVFMALAAGLAWAFYR